MTQQALSRNIQHLEAWAGQPLIYRHPGQLQLTPAGSLVLQETPRLLQDLLQAYCPTQQASNTVHIGVSALWGRHYLTQALLSLFDSEEAPELLVSPLGEQDIITFLLAGELDLGLILNPPWHGLQTCALPTIPWVLAGAPDLLEQEVFPYYVLMAEEWPHSFHDANVLPQPARCLGYTNSFSILHELLLVGLGAAFMPWPYVRDDVRAGRLMRFETPDLPVLQPSAIWIKELAPAARRLLTMLAQEMER